MKEDQEKSKELAQKDSEGRKKGRKDYIEKENLEREGGKN